MGLWMVPLCRRTARGCTGDRGLEPRLKPRRFLPSLGGRGGEEEARLFWICYFPSRAECYSFHLALCRGQFLGYSDVLPGYAIVAPRGTLCQVSLFEHLSLSDEKREARTFGNRPTLTLACQSTASF